MSLISAVLIPAIEKKLLEASPELQTLALSELKYFGADLIDWATKKIEGKPQVPLESQNV